MLNECEIQLDSELYHKESIMKTAYHFIDKYYIFITKDNLTITVQIMPKKEQKFSAELRIQIEGEFRNELLNQEVRRTITKDTKNIRELILSRAMYSTYIEEPESIQESETEFCIDAIAKDWFEEDNNEQ